MKEGVNMVYLTPTHRPGQKIRLSRSAHAILELLDNKQAPLAVKEIRDELPLSERTIHYALRQLREYALIEKKINMRDLRETRYLLAAKAALYGYYPL